jgi:hypothetical protein
MEEPTSVNGSTTKCTERVSSPGRTEEPTRENTKMTKRMATVSSHGNNFQNFRKLTKNRPNQVSKKGQWVNGKLVKEEK